MEQRRGWGVQNVSHMAISRTKITQNKNTTVSFKFLTPWGLPMTELTAAFLPQKSLGITAIYRIALLRGKSCNCDKPDTSQTSWEQLPGAKDTWKKLISAQRVTPPSSQTQTLHTPLFWGTVARTGFYSFSTGTLKMETLLQAQKSKLQLTVWSHPKPRNEPKVSHERTEVTGLF